MIIRDSDMISKISWCKLHACIIRDSISWATGNRVEWEKQAAQVGCKQAEK